MMHKLKVRANHTVYIIFAVLSLFSLTLIFNDNIWFDEAYTLSLIQHNYSDIINILKSDMHPPLYFLSLKTFCCIFGYSITATKIFSAIGYIATLFLGCTIIKKHYGSKTSIIYMLTVGAVPMMLYFSVQQRSYSWSIFFVTLCFIESLIFIENKKLHNCILFAIAGLGAAYNHIYALLAVAIIFAFANIYLLIKDRNLFKRVIIADLIMVAGYSFWIIPLLNQTKSASSNFWLSGVEPLSVIVFISGIAVSALVLMKKSNRKLCIIFADVCVMGIQIIGLFVTVFIRPFYIARYSVVILGIFAILVAFGVKDIKPKPSKVICTLLCVVNIGCLVATGLFEYNPSMTNFRERFSSQQSESDTFVYCDSAFGIMSYYYPNNTHLCTYKENWFEAFENVECINKNEIADKVDPNHKIWFVKNELTKMPKCIKSNFKYKKIDSFQCDFNKFDLYLLILK